MDFSVVRQFLERTDAFQTTQGRLDVFRELVEIFRLRNLTFCSIKPTFRTLCSKDVVTTYPLEWCELYLENKFENTDPVLQGGLKRCGVTNWSSLTSDNPEEEAFMTKASRHGISGPGVIVSIARSREVIGLLSLQFREDSYNDYLTRPNSAATLTSLTHLIAQLMPSVAAERPSQRGQLLTGREQEVLSWAAFGKSCWETAGILGLSERTVGSYVHNAKQKLDAATKTQAVVLAVNRGLIDLELFARTKVNNDRL